jgi:death-on-curing protein
VIDHLTLADVLAIHEDQLARYGGSPGVRDFGLLEAALFRPQTGYYVDVIAEASALWESLAQNRPFVDDDKRTAFAATDTFLAINDVRITADADSTYVFIIGLHETASFRFDQLEAWLRTNTVPMSDGA